LGSRQSEFGFTAQAHSIVGNAHVDATLGGHDPEFRRELALVAGDNLRAAMRDDGSRYASFSHHVNWVRTGEWPMSALLSWTANAFSKL